LCEALVSMAEAEDSLRAIGVDGAGAFVVSQSDQSDHGGRLLTPSTNDRAYRMFVESMRDGAATLSSDGIIVYANRRLAELLSCPKEAIVGFPLAMFVAGTAPVELEESWSSGGHGAILELDLLDANGVAVPVLVGIAPLELGGDRLSCLTFTDLSAQKAHEREITRFGQAQGERLADLQQAQAALTAQATHDALTGLPNRALFTGRIDQALCQSKRSGRCIAVLFVDLDRFKNVNDTHGHAAGDAVLRRVAGKLVAALRPMDTVARIGGDEFVILAPEVDSHLHAVDIGNRIVAVLTGSAEQVEDGERVTASVGISLSVGGRGTAEILLNEADIAMYHAKSLGRGRCEVFDVALRRQVEQRSAGELMLRSALDDNRIIAHYQPVIDLSTGRVCGFEALARIAEHDGSIVAPAAFITIAEQSGLVVPLGTRVLEMACHEASRWQASGLILLAAPVSGVESRLTVAVNLSSRQFEAGNLRALVEDRLEQTGLDARQLHLELTETAIVDLRPDSLRQLARITDLGVQIGLDDFGTGYASLAHLRRLPLTFVKIDQSFVQGLETDREAERLVAAVVDLAHNLGLRSIAEGVETSYQLDRLRQLGCDQAQGYLFARPLPPDEVVAAILHDAW
jgi:diguanylate cyclase (GGDEF)-like protein